MIYEVTLDDQALDKSRNLNMHQVITKQQQVRGPYSIEKNAYSVTSCQLQTGCEKNFCNTALGGNHQCWLHER